VHFVKG
jgi:hypothetical protein